jgi:hypothetical protein
MLMPMQYPYGVMMPGMMVPGVYGQPVMGQAMPVNAAAAAAGQAPAQQPNQPRQRRRGGVWVGLARQGQDADLQVRMRVQGNPQGQPVNVRMIRINLRAIIQFMVLALVLWQNTPPTRFLIIMTVAIFLYITGLEPLRAVMQGVMRRIPNLHQAGFGNGAGRAGQAAGGAAAAAAAAPARQRGLLGEIQALVIGFFASLLPGFNEDPADAAAFAQAQQMAANDAQVGNQARPHAD